MVRPARPVVAVLLSGVFAIAAGGRFDARQRQSPELTVHEWGTFTTVAGVDGQSIQWLPLGGPTDLPCFVEHYQNPLYKIDLTDAPAPLDYDTARGRLLGKVRMETPVVYFYAPHDLTASVSVDFPQGLMTEWYPAATVSQPRVDASSLLWPTTSSRISWPVVDIRPGGSSSFAGDGRSSHYYAARDTDAAPVRVRGADEKFLFYRGVAGFDVPLSAVVLDDGTVRVKNLGADPLPDVIVFQADHGRMGFSDAGPVRRDATIPLPAPTSDLAALKTDLARRLVESGLYPREAQAMVETWRDSWFEDGTRVFYLMPRVAVDAVLPLSIAPEPGTIVRSFVGRMELVTPAAEEAVLTAVRQGDRASLERFARFLGPIADRIRPGLPAADRAALETAAHDAFAAYLARESSCQ